MALFKSPWKNYLLAGIGVSLLIIFLAYGAYESQASMGVSSRGSKRLFNLILAIMDNTVGKVGVYSVLGIINLIMYYLAYDAYKFPENYKEEEDIK